MKKIAEIILEVGKEEYNSKHELHKACFKAARDKGYYGKYDQDIIYLLMQCCESSAINWANHVLSK